MEQLLEQQEIPFTLDSVAKNLDNSTMYHHAVNNDVRRYAKLKDIGEVVYTRLPTGETLGKVKEVEFILYNDGESKHCGGFGIDRPFTSTGKYRNTFDGDLVIVEEMESIPDINKWMAKFGLLGLK